MTGALLRVDDLSVRYGGVAALDGVTFGIDAGQIVGLIGPNGAGKTTCIDALTGFTAPSRGRITFQGVAIDALAPHERARRGFVRTFQSLELFDDLTVRQNVLVGSSTPTWRDTLTDALWPKTARGSAADEALERTGIDDVADRMPTELSNGQRHLVVLARALAARPALLLLDEPAAGLDPTETAALGALIRMLPDRGTSVLLVDHDMPLVLGTCDRVLVLDFGRLIAEGAPADVRVDPTVIAAYLGRSAAEADA